MTEPAPTSILLVDDEPSLREPLAEYLSRQGFVVREADSAAQARTLIAQELPDLALLDIMMPGEDGLSLCRHLVESRGLPTILLTAKGEAMDRIIGLEIGADDYVTKPFEPRELVARIRSVLRRAERPAAAAARAAEEEAAAPTAARPRPPRRVPRQPAPRPMTSGTNYRWVTVLAAAVIAGVVTGLVVPRVLDTDTGWIVALVVAAVAGGVVALATRERIDDGKQVRDDALDR